MLRQVLVKIPNTKFHENPTDGLRALPRGDGWVDITRLTEATRSAKARRIQDPTTQGFAG